MSGLSRASDLIEEATIRKLRIRLLPFLFALYVVAFIDRINVGFAALTMNRELAITSQQFGLRLEFSFGATSCLRSPATSSFTASARASGSRASSSHGASLRR